MYEIYNRSIHNKEHYSLSDGPMLIADITFRRTPKQFKIIVCGFAWNDHFTRAQKQEIKTLINTWIDKDLYRSIEELKRVFHIY